MKKNTMTDLFGDDVQSNPAQEKSFAELFSAETADGRDAKVLKVGSEYNAEILSIGKDESFVVGTAGLDAQIPSRELKDSSGQLLFKVGDTIRVKVVRRREAELVVKRSDSVASSDDSVDSLEDAFDLEIPIKGKVTEEVKGGFRVEIQGGIKAFCPFSQIELNRAADTSQYIGKSFEFLITQYEKRNVVLSRRRLLELKKAEHEGAFLLTAKAGDRFTGEITRIERFGAFCRLENGIEGLIPISELAWGRVLNPSDVVSPGQTVQVILLRMEEEGTRLKIALSLKQAGETVDPWITVEEKFRPGVIYQGTVEKKEVFGLFVQLTPGLTGLLPKSSWRDEVDGAKFESKKKGDSIEVTIDQIDRAARRLSLKPPGDSSLNDWMASAQKGKAGDRGASLGTFGDLLKGLQVPGKPQAASAAAKSTQKSQSQK